LVLAEEQGPADVGSYTYDVSSPFAPPGPPFSPPGGPAFPPAPARPPASVKDDATTYFVAEIALSIFVSAWLAKDIIRAITCIRFGHWLMGEAIGLVTLVGFAGTIIYAVKEASAEEGYQPHKIILESVTVLLILDLDEKVYEGVQVLLGDARLESLIGKEDEGQPASLASIADSDINETLNTISDVIRVSENPEKKRNEPDKEDTTEVLGKS
jgi:hypothetical protein